MARLTLLFLFIFVAATQVKHTVAHRDSTKTGPFFFFTTYTGNVTFRNIGDTKSCPVKPWTPEQTAARVRNATIVFDKPYLRIPSVAFTVSLLDVNKDFNFRYDAQIVEVTNRCFTIQFSVWCNTFIYSARVNYWITGGKQYPKFFAPPST
eukprot:g7301.t1